MCGIYSIISTNSISTRNILNQVELLEYRGYDSVGIYFNNHIFRTIGATCELRKKLKRRIGEKTKLALCHTRWATHGKPSEINAHPHKSFKNKFVIVQNGIIENYEELKKILRDNKFGTLTGETDTEVLVNYIEFVSERYNLMSNLEVISFVMQFIKGSYAFVLHNTEDNDIFVIKKNINIFIGNTNNGFEISSDKCAFTDEVKKIIIPDNNSIALISNPRTINYYKQYKLIPYEPREMSNIQHCNIPKASKDEFDHFMLKEIHDQIQTLNYKNINTNDLVNLSLNNNIKNIVIGACGSSYYAGCWGKLVLEEITCIPVQVEIASEYISRETPAIPNSLYIFISQSGETADTIAMLRKVKQNDTESQTLAICNVTGSTIPSECSASIYMNCGPEIGVASTKSFTNQMMCLLLLAHYIECPTRNNSYLEDIPNNIEYIITNFKNEIKTNSHIIKNAKSILIMGRKYNYPIAMEGALKLKEITYIHSEGFSSSEMKHGVIALVDPETPIFYIMPNDSIYEKNKNNYEELKARNANILLLGHTIKTKKDFPEYTFSFYIVVILQLYSYYIGLAKGNSIDKPRNLAKSVTVE